GPPSRSIMQETCRLSSPTSSSRCRKRTITPSPFASTSSGRRRSIDQPSGTRKEKAPDGSACSCLRSTETASWAKAGTRMSRPATKKTMPVAKGTTMIRTSARGPAESAAGSGRSFIKGLEKLCYTISRNTSKNKRAVLKHVRRALPGRARHHAANTRSELPADAAGARKGGVVLDLVEEDSKARLPRLPGEGAGGVPHPAGHARPPHPPPPPPPPPP